MSTKHGVYKNEVATSLKIAKSSAGVPVYLVTAPVHLATEPKIQEPQICYKLSDVAKYFGFQAGNHDFTSNKVAEIFFQYELIAPIVLINTLDPSVHFTQVTDKNLTVTARKAIITDKNANINSLVVKNGANTLTLNTDYYATYNAGTIEIELDEEYNDGIMPGSILATYKIVDPSKVTTAEIIGSVDVDGKKTGMELINSVFRKYRLVPNVLAAPKYSATPSVAAILKTKANKVSTFFQSIALIDHPDDVKFEDFPAWKKEKNINDPLQFCLYGYGTIGDYHYEPSILIGAQMMRVDMTHDGRPCESPSNKSLPIDGACIIIGGNKVALNLEHEEANFLNDNGICTIYNSPNGWVSWGSETACYPDSEDSKDFILDWKRMMIHYGNNFILNEFSNVDKMVNPRFIQNALTKYNQLFNKEVAKEYILAGKIYWNADDNQVVDIVEGLQQFQFIFTFSPKAKGIIANLELDLESLPELLAQ